MNGYSMSYNKPERYMWHSAKGGAKKRNIFFDIQPHHIKIPAVCPLLDIPIEFSHGKGYSDNSPSLDRIDNTKGYTPDNIWVISRLANMMKSSASPEQLTTFAYNVLKKFKS